MRLLVTADLHINHPRSRPLAIDLIRRLNQIKADIMLLVGDTSTADDDQLESALKQIEFSGPRLFLCGNHELWTRRADSHDLFVNELPKRVQALGWHWLEENPYIGQGVSVIGSVGWYDYSYAPAYLGVPHRFYEAKVSPGAAQHLGLNHLVGPDLTPESLSIFARWNDGKNVKLGRSDEVFLEERLVGLRESLSRVPSDHRIVAAVHHVPFYGLLPPRHDPVWDFARAYLGSERIGELLLSDHRITHVFCGHSHFPIEKKIGHMHGINVGSGYRLKRFWIGHI